MSAPVFDAVSTAEESAATSPLTWSHTCTGTNLLLLVGSLATGHGSSNVTGITYNGVALTKSAATVVNATTNDRYDLWYLIAPASGAHNIVATLSPSDLLGNSFVAASYTGVHQTVPFGTVATATGTNATDKVTVTSASGETVVAFAGHDFWDSGFGTHFTATTTANGNTERGRQNSPTGTPTNGANVLGVFGEAAGAATVNMQWDISTSLCWGIIGVSLKPVAAAGRVFYNSSVDGIGGAGPKQFYREG